MAKELQNQLQKDQHQQILNSVIDDDDPEDVEQLGEDDSDADDVEDDSEDEIGEDDDRPEIEDDDDESSTEPVDEIKAARDRLFGKKEEKQPEKDSLRFAEDKHGNLVDKDGKILFTAGKGRALFEKLKKGINESTVKLNGANKELQEIKFHAGNLVKTHKELLAKQESYKQHGLNDTEVSEALAMRAQFKLDPVGAVRNLLTKLHLNGTDLSNIGVNAPLDPKALAQHFIGEFEARQPKPETPEEAARKEARAFLDMHPDAAQHIALIGEAKQAYPHMSLGQIWFEIKSAAMRQKASTKPVEKQPQKVTARNTSPTHPQSSKRVLSTTPVDPNTSFRDIGKQLLRDLKQLS